MWGGGGGGGGRGAGEGVSVSTASEWPPASDDFANLRSTAGNCCVELQWR